MRPGFAALAFACGLIGGCGLLPIDSQEPAPATQAGGRRPATEVEGPRPATEVDGLLVYFQHARKLPAGELGKEHDLARQAYASSRTDYNRVRWAMLLSLPGTALTDEPRALELLDPVVRNGGGRFHGLATLLAANLQERRRLDANAQGLQQKLDALRSLERSMIERK